MFFKILPSIFCAAYFFFSAVSGGSNNETAKNCGTIKHGTLMWYKLATHAVCYNFQCNNGVHEFLDYGCLDANKKCNRQPYYNYPCNINGKRFSKCSCQKKGGKFNIQPPCLDPITNTEYGFGETWISHQNRICVTFYCDWAEQKIINTACRSLDGECITPNTETPFKCLFAGSIKSNCLCTRTKSGQIQVSTVERVATSNTKEAKITCEDAASGLKYQVGEQWISKNVESNSCSFYRCAVNNTMPYKLGCLDSERTCQVAGSSGFSCVLNGIVHPSCECVSHDSGNLMLNSLGCLDPDTRQTYADTISWTTRTKHRCFSRTCKAGYIEQVASCNSQSGTCFDRGAQDFPCYYGEKPYARCICDYATIYPYPQQ